MEVSAHQAFSSGLGYDINPLRQPAITEANLSKALLDFEQHLRHLENSITNMRRQLRDVEATSLSLVETISAVRQPEVRSFAALTRQERRVAAYAACGASDAAIAMALNLSINTVKCHVKAALRRLSLHSRWELAYILSDAPQSRQEALASCARGPSLAMFTCPGLSLTPVESRRDSVHRPACEAVAQCTHSIASLKLQRTRSG